MLCVHQPKWTFTTKMWSLNPKNVKKQKVQHICCLQKCTMSKWIPGEWIFSAHCEMSLYACIKELLLKWWMNMRGHGECHLTKKALHACWDREKTSKWSFRLTAAGDLEVNEKKFCPDVMWPQNLVGRFWITLIHTRSRSADFREFCYHTDYVQVVTDRYKILNLLCPI